jgi:hypothetical protein
MKREINTYLANRSRKISQRARKSFKNGATFKHVGKENNVRVSFTRKLRG